MRHLQLAIILALSAAGSPLWGEQPKSLDCLQVFVTGSDSVVKQSKTPIRVRVLHLVLKNICSVDITAFSLEADIKSPVAQKFRHADDMVGRLRPNSSLYNKIPLAGRDFPYDYSFRDDSAGESPFEGAVKVTALAFRDLTVIGESDWVNWIERTRKADLRDFTDKLALLVKVARLSDAKMLLQGDPDNSLDDDLKAFWREIKGNVGNDPVEWGAYVNWRVKEMQDFIRLLKEQSELRREGN